MSNSKKFQNKKLLVLGTSVGSVEIVKYAKENGAYVIVTDYLPSEKSKAKQFADETAMISTLDVDELCAYAKEKEVDGVFCGVSEENLHSVYCICNKLGLPCYFNKNQWDICQNKSSFKDLCKKFDLPIANQYSYEDVLKNVEDNGVLKCPVIVKPVDRSAAIGIHICYTLEEFIKGYSDAIDKSHTKKALIERYVCGDEFSAAYTICNGEYKLSIMGDKYLNREQEGFIPLPEAYVYPSKNLNFYTSNYNDKVINMFKSIGLNNGTVFVQGIINKNEVVIIEAGLRMGGTALFRFLENINGTNILKLLTDYALTGKMEADLSLEDPNLKNKRCCLLSMLNKGGVINKIVGVDEASKINGVVETVVRYQEGETIIKNGTLKQSHIRFFIVENTSTKLIDSVRKIQSLVQVLDANGNNMLLGPFDVSKLDY